MVVSLARHLISLYDANRNQVRADEAEFQGKVYAIEDGLLA